jgi:hypothetical protein
MLIYSPFFCFFFFFSIHIHVCIHCLGHFSPLLPVPSLSLPPPLASRQNLLKMASVLNLYEAFTFSLLLFWFDYAFLFVCFFHGYSVLSFMDTVFCLAFWYWKFFWSVFQFPMLPNFLWVLSFSILAYVLPKRFSF